MSGRLAIRELAAAHIRALGFGGPPFDHRASLRSRGLALLDDPLEAVLAESGLPEEERAKIDGFVDLRGRVVCLRSGLHPHQYRTGLLHEVAHDVIPWQRELLHYCPIFSLPPELQRDFEWEANAFAVECCFFADRFIDRVRELPAHLGSAVALADDHVASYEATFRHYVENQPLGCLLLVSVLVGVDQVSGQAVFEIRQYIKSPAAGIVARPRQRFGGPELSALVLGLGGAGVVDHTVAVDGPPGPRRYVAQSFWNTYKLFTLLWL